MNKNKLIIAVVLALIIGAAGGFLGGMEYQKQNQPFGMMGNFARNGQNQTGANNNDQRRMLGNSNGFRPVSGQIMSIDEKSMTIKMSDGSTKIVLLSSTTPINKESVGNKGDLMTGVTVSVFGTQNPDGSVTATAIQIGGMAMMGQNSRRQVNSGSKSADATEIVVQASNFKFDQTALTIPVGQKTRILFKNIEGVHDFVIEGMNIGTAVLQAGQQDFLEITPEKAGTYEFYCSVGSHRQMGMKGTLTVK